MKDLIFSIFFFYKRQLSAFRTHSQKILPAAISLSLLVKDRHPASCLLHLTSLYMIISKVVYMLIYYLVVI